MNNIFFQILIFPGCLFTGIIGLLLSGIDRKVIAKMQRRVGPPIVQPLYDFLKLLGKETIVPAAANKKVYMAAPVIGFSALMVLTAFTPIMGASIVGERSDLIIFLYLLTIPAVCLIVAGSSTGNPYAGIGISREMVTVMSYELPLILVFLAVAKKVGGNILDFSFNSIALYQIYNGSLIKCVSLIPAAIALLLVIPAEVGVQPFDVAEAETEICEGPLVEYSGAPLAVFKLNTSIKMYIMTALFTNLFLGGLRTGNIALDALIQVALSIVLTILCMTTVHAVTARLKVEHLFKFFWTVVAGLAALSLVLVWLGF